LYSEPIHKKLKKKKSTTAAQLFGNSRGPKEI